MDLDRLKDEFGHSGNEGAVLACVLRNPDLFYEVETNLDETDFLTDHNRALWSIIRALVRESVSSLDTTSILTQASSMGLEKEIHGYAYVSALFDKEVNPSNLDFYVSKVVDASAKYKMLRLTNNLVETINKNKSLSPDTLSAKDILDGAQAKLLKISLDSCRAAEATDLSEGLEDLLDEFRNSVVGSMGLFSGFPILDEKINGFEPGTLTVLGARPKTGKSATLLNWAINIAYEQGVPTLYIDTEMSKREQQTRLLSILSAIPERHIKKGLFRDSEDYSSLLESAQKIVASGILRHKYFPDFSAESLESLIRKEYHQNKVRCVIFDYIKLSDDDLTRMNNVKEHQSLGYLCSALKKIAGQLQIPVISAAQIGRLGANKSRVGASDFADSDRILRYANTLLGYAQKTKEELDEAEEKFGKEVARKMGTHRLQILSTRAGGEFYQGIDIYFRKEILTVREATEQTSEHTKEEGGSNDDFYA